jgi:hypothetical protein
MWLKIFLGVILLLLVMLYATRNNKEGFYPGFVPIGPSPDGRIGTSGMETLLKSKACPNTFCCY